MNHEARKRLGELLAHIYRDHLRENSHCLSMEDRKAAIEDMETTLYKVRNIIGSIRYSGLLYLKNTKAPKVTLEQDAEAVELNLKKAGNSAGEGTAADHLRILLDRPSVVYMSLATGAPNSALVVNEDNKIDMNLFYRSVLKDTTPGTGNYAHSKYKYTKLQQNRCSDKICLWCVIKFNTFQFNKISIFS